MRDTADQTTRRMRDRITTPMPQDQATITAGAMVPAEAGAEIRRLAHDLANALEVIIQASYLLQISQLEGDAKRWAEMVDQGAQQAADINRKLREYVRSHTS